MNLHLEAIMVTMGKDERTSLTSYRIEYASVAVVLFVVCFWVAVAIILATYT